MKQNYKLLQTLKRKFVVLFRNLVFFLKKKGKCTEHPYLLECDPVLLDE